MSMINESKSAENLSNVDFGVKFLKKMLILLIYLLSPICYNINKSIFGFLRFIGKITKLILKRRSIV